MFSAELARYYTDNNNNNNNNNNIEEIEAQLYLVKTRFNRKRLRIINNKDNPALQTFILI